jgi:hypothetical protein
MSDKYGALGQRDVVGDVGELDLPVPAVLPTDRFHRDDRQRVAYLPVLA